MIPAGASLEVDPFYVVLPRGWNERGNSGARIRNVDTCLAILRVDRDRHAPALRGVLERIGRKIEQHLVQESGVAIHVDMATIRVKYQARPAHRLGARFEDREWEPQLRLALLGQCIRQMGAQVDMAYNHQNPIVRDTFRANVPWWCHQARARTEVVVSGDGTARTATPSPHSLISRNLSRSEARR